MDFRFSDITLSSVDCSSRRFRISKPGPSQKLVESVSKNGIIDPPVLFRDGECYIPLSGHNRLNAALGAGIKTVRCLVAPGAGYDFFLSHAALKNFRGELGVAGRIRAAAIAAGLRGLACADGEICAALELPPAAASSMNDVLLLDERLLSYCDEKSLPMKTLMILPAFPPALRDALAGWIGRPNVRMNMFKSAVDLLEDLMRVKPLEELCGIVMQHASEPDDALVTALYAIRNPVIAQMNVKSEAIIAEFRRQQVEIVYPPYFEGSSVEVKLRMKRADNGASCRKSLEYLLESDFSEMLDLL